MAETQTAAPLATERQLAYLVALLDERDHDFPKESVANWNKGLRSDGKVRLSRKSASALIDVLLREPKSNPAKATPQQADFMRKLLADRDVEADVAAHWQELLDSGEMTREGASNILDWLKVQPMKATEFLDFPEVGPVASLEGMHRTADGTIYKVQRAVHGSGHLYAKQLVAHRECDGHESTDGPIGNVVYCDGTCAPEAETEWKFEFAPGALRLLSEDTKLTLEDAKQFGVVYGSCVVCGRTLTDEKSIAAGIGPVCAKRFG